MEHITAVDNVKDAIGARNIALDYLVKEGIVVFVREIVSICKKHLSWIVEIVGKTFTGVIVIDSKTCKVVSANRL